MPKVIFELVSDVHVKDQLGVRRVLLPLSKALSMDVTVHDPHGCTHHPDFALPGFHVYIWSAPNEDIEQECTPPRIIWGTDTHGVVCHDESYEASGVGIDIADGNFSIAELIDDRFLYLLLDLTHEGSDVELQLLKRVVDEVIDIVSDSTSLPVEALV